MTWMALPKEESSTRRLSMMVRGKEPFFGTDSGSVTTVAVFVEIKAGQTCQFVHK